MKQKYMMLKIMSSSECVFRGEVQSITLPSIGGEIGILPGHMPFLSGLKAGKVRIVDSEGKKHEVSVQSGSIRFDDDRCVVTIFDALANPKVSASK